MSQPLDGKVALVAGGTRGAGRGIATQLGTAGATVYVTGRSTRSRPADSGAKVPHGGSEMNRPETIEETAELVTAAGGLGIAVPLDHLEPDQVASLVQRIETDHGALHILVNSIWGATVMEWESRSGSRTLT